MVVLAKPFRLFTARGLELVWSFFDEEDDFGIRSW